jgi:hypothetical protein
MYAEDVVDFLRFIMFIVEVFDDESFLEVSHVTVIVSMEGKMRAKRARARAPTRVVLKP